MVAGMSTILIFIITSGELIALALGAYLPVPELSKFLLTYGSPPYLILGLLNQFDGILQEHPLIPLIVFGHAIKYIILARANFLEDRRSLFYLAVIFEITYLFIGFVSIL